MVKRRASFYSTFIKKGDLCFDVGANIGNRVEPLLKLKARVVAVEPQAKCCLVLKYKFGSKISIVNSGLSEQEGVAPFFISSSHTLSSFSGEWVSKVKEGRFKDDNWDKVQEVKVTTLDKLIEKYGQPHFIKIDTEGYETQVLKGLSRSVEYISFEYTIPEQTEKTVECIKIASRHGSSVECNYSRGENMEWMLQKWVNPDELISRIQNGELLESGFGDIYIRLIH